MKLSHAAHSIVGCLIGSAVSWHTTPEATFQASLLGAVALAGVVVGRYLAERFNERSK